MDDKTYARLTENIRTIFTSLVKGFGLTRIRFSLAFERDPAHVHDDGSQTLAAIHPSWQYGSATLQVFVPGFEDLSDDEIADILIHELVHYWINGISRYGSSAEYDLLEERTCTEIAWAIRSIMGSVAREIRDKHKKEMSEVMKDFKKLAKEARSENVA